MAQLDKKALPSWKRKHDLHVLLIMERYKCGKAEALVTAYHEGVEGVGKLMTDGYAVAAEAMKKNG